MGTQITAGARGGNGPEGSGYSSPCVLKLRIQTPANPANQISSPNYSYDGTGNLTQDPDSSYAYNGAQQMTSVTKGGTTYNYTYAGTSQNQVLS